jgi:hypothetical protein
LIVTNVVVKILVWLLLHLQEERRRVLRKCLGRINQEVMDAAEQGVAVRCVGWRGQCVGLSAINAIQRSFIRFPKHRQYAKY